MPVVEPHPEGNRLCGMISITDVVRARVEELEAANHLLEEYLTGR